MNDNEQDFRQRVALFRYGLIADCVHQPLNQPGLYARLQEKAAREYLIPGSTRTRVAAETLRDWIKRYRHQGGFDALLPQPRADRGQSRTLPAAVAEALIALKEANPKLSVNLIIQKARADGKAPAELPLPPSTVHRLLSKAGLMDPKIGEPSAQDRRRFAFARAGQLWMSDVMHGPTGGGGRRGAPQGLSDRLSRRCHAGGDLCRLRAVGEHPCLSAGAETGPAAPRPAGALVCGQRGQLPLPPPLPGLRQARGGADPCPSLSTPARRLG